MEDEISAVASADLEREVAALYARHSKDLHRFATLILRRQDGAPDAVQETFLRYFAERKCGAEIDNPRAWLYRVLHNHLLDRLAKASFKHEVTADDLEEPMDAAHDPETRIARFQAARQIAADLTGREFDCLRLRAEGLSYEEVAAVLGIRSGTVGALLSRVRRKLLDVPQSQPVVRLGIAQALESILHEKKAR